MLNDDKSMTSFTQQLYDARQPGSAIANIDHKNIQQDLPSRRAEGAKRKAQIQQEEDEYDDEMDLSDGNRVERR